MKRFGQIVCYGMTPRFTVSGMCPYSGCCHKQQQQSRNSIFEIAWEHDSVVLDFANEAGFITGFFMSKQL